SNLKKGSNPHKTPETIQAVSGNGINALAALHGVGEDSLQRAYKVLDLPASKRAPLVNAIMCGDISLGGAVAGIAGEAATKGKARKDTDAVRRLDASFRSFEHNFRFWKSAPAAERVRLANVARELAKSLPSEIVAALARGCKEVLKGK
nr:hypothetical protein [Victivallaceae bacterium]